MPARSMPQKKPKPASRTRRLYLRATERQSKLIREVASRQGTSVTDFILDAACARAEQVILDQRHFVVPAEIYDQFAAALDRPARPKAALKRLISERSILER